MISFIIIGKNIEKTIGICLSSLQRLVDANNLVEYEAIYVDSGSLDRSVDIAKEFEVSILVISGSVNSAVARNAGAAAAKGEILFFIDGDMELLPGFFEQIYSKEKRGLNYPFINGYLIHHYYNSGHVFLNAKEEAIKSAHYSNVTGGLMIVERAMWDKLKGMDERLVRNQDLDFGLRMKGIGFPVLKDPRHWVIHHTVSYYDGSRASYFFGSSALLAPGLLMRKHFFSLPYWSSFYRTVFYVSLLFTAFALLFLWPFLSAMILLFYLAINLMRAIKNARQEKLLRSFSFKSLFNFYALFGFLFYYPGQPKYSVKKLEQPARG